MGLQRKIYPPLAAQPCLRQTLTVGESRVLHFFDQHLDQNWEIYIQPHLNGLRPDFVLMNPKVGIAVFEIKDWDFNAMQYSIRKDRWGHAALWAKTDGKDFCLQKQNPITKVNIYKKEIFDLYCPRLGERNGWAAITAGVIFPFARASDVVKLFTPFLQGGVGGSCNNYQPISGIDELSAGDLEAVFPESNRRTSTIMSEELASDLRGWLVEPDFSATQRTPLFLDRNQRFLATSRTESGYRRIKGPAGSGKSVVLAARAARLANEGKEVLVATFNITLWHYLRDLIVRDLESPGALKNVQFTHFHLWCKHACYDVGWDRRYHALWNSNVSDGHQQDILDRHLPQLAEDAITQPGARLYDAILVDEGQDYQPLWWNVLRKACKPDGEMLLVADATQDVYGTARAWTDDVMTGAGFPGGRWAQLKVSYRLPPHALRFARDFADAFLPKEIVDLPEPEQGTLDLYPCHLRWIQCDAGLAGEKCADAILGLMHHTGEHGLANADITVLVCDRKSGEDVVARLADYGVRAINTFGQHHRRRKMGFYMGDARVKVTTLHSFKGWEARLIVLLVTAAAYLNSKSLIYAGLTRLKRSQQGSWLTVVSSAPELENFGRNFPDCVNLTDGGQGSLN